MATVFLFCLAIGFAIVGVVAFLIALLNGEIATAFMALVIAPILFWWITLPIAVLTFFILKAKYELRRW